MAWGIVEYTYLISQHCIFYSFQRLSPYVILFSGLWFLTQAIMFLVIYSQGYTIAMFEQYLKKKASGSSDKQAEDHADRVGLQEEDQAIYFDEDEELKSVESLLVRDARTYSDKNF